MRYKIKNIGDDGVEVRVDVTEAWLKAECPEIEMRTSPEGVHLTGRIEPTGEEYLLRGDLKGSVIMTCARCLEPATLPLDVPIIVTYAEVEDPADEEEDAEAGDILPIVDGVIDVGSEVRDELLLALPMRPLCREDCAGICPTCGVNRNLTPCDCAARAGGGGKLSALAKVKL
jgi:uncharacterized metal-binding protein YceD (DUF177 family)